MFFYYKSPVYKMASSRGNSSSNSVC